MREVSVNKKFWFLFPVVMVLILATVLMGGCKKEYTVQDAVISEVTMAAAVDSNDRPLQPTSVFPPDAEAIYCSLKLSHFPPGTQIRAEWIYLGGATMVGVAANTTIYANIGTVEGDGYTALSMQRPQYEGVKWPIGDYKVVFSAEGVEKASASFKVE
jgi:hypothetical protein